MDEYKSNSHKSRELTTQNETSKKVEKVVSGTVKTKKKSGLEKIAGIFVSEDADNVKSYILTDIIIPAVKKTVSDIVTNGIDMILYGGSGKIGRGNSPASRISYNNCYSSIRRDPEPSRYRATYAYDDIVLETRGEAEEVLSRMDELMSRYKVVSVADLYDMVGIQGNYTDNKYGWTDIHTAHVERIRDGYLLKLPRAMPLD